MNGQDVLSMPVALPEGIDHGEYIIGTYLVCFPKNIPVPFGAQLLAIEQSTGTWVAVPGETPEVRRKHVAKVIGVYEVPDYEFSVPSSVETRNYIVQTAYPEVNIGEQIPMLLTTVVGNISMAGQVKLVDIYLP